MQILSEIIDFLLKSKASAGLLSLLSYGHDLAKIGDSSTPMHRIQVHVHIIQ